MRRPGIAAVALLLLVAGTRLVLAAAYASPVPFWDQWDAEGANLLAPWLDGTLPASRWFDAHNEHRVLWTRLLTLGLFEANGGQWDNLVAALANCVFPGLLAALLYAGLHGGLASRSTRAVLFVGLMLLGVLPFGWENLVVGFQSQFFLMVLIASSVMLLAGATGEMVLLGALYRFLNWILYGFMALLIIDAIFSWVNPNAPLAPFVHALNTPILRPIRRVVPPIGGIDLSVLVALVLIQIIQFILRQVFM